VLTHRAALPTGAALGAFALSSLLCRLALGGGEIGPEPFTVVRLGSGALVLVALARARRASDPLARARAGWREAALLALYAIPFSYAYVSLPIGTGALLLFGTVQVTMVCRGLLRCHRPETREWVALVGGACGLVYLVAPGLTAPDPTGSAAMVAAGIGWGLYSAPRARPGDPILDTERSFRLASLIVVVFTLGATAFSGADFAIMSGAGVALAVASGAGASALGYVAWHRALPALSGHQPALLQLSVPVLAALLGVAVLDEVLSFRLLVAGALVLGSIAWGTLAKTRAHQSHPATEGGTA
jgi:drug/metabolite transporter (DMT)-like permease